MTRRTKRASSRFALSCKNETSPTKCLTASFALRGENVSRSRGNTRSTKKFRTGGKLGIANASTRRMTFENLESFSPETEFVAREIIADTIGGQSHVNKNCNQ